MTALTMNYVVNPIAGIWRSIQCSFVVAGHVRAAAELARMGYHKEAKAIMLELKNFRDSE